ncbi:MAG: hypothetical protein ICV68_12490 [Pyrinomonadaceae bacterium]|nr:hypothetical protein [Pyrinomonadaceae bacterium]
MNKPDEQAIARAAQAAIHDLQLDCRVEKVFEHPHRSDKWCIQFTGDYGQFCDEFRNESGEVNSPRLMREKVKGYFLKMRKPVRVRRGRKPKADKQESILPGLSTGIVGEVIGQTTRLAGEVVNQVSGLARSVLETEAVVSVELPTVVPLPPPPRKSKRVRRAATKKPARSGSGKATRKKSVRAGKSTSKPRKAAKRAGSKKQTTSAKKKRASKKRK